MGSGSGFMSEFSSKCTALSKFVAIALNVYHISVMVTLFVMIGEMSQSVISLISSVVKMIPSVSLNS